MLRKILLSTIAVASFGSSAAALADDDRSSYRRQIRDFFDCAYTRPVRFPGTIVDAAIATPELSILTHAVIDAGLAETLSGPGPFTVYAPLNSAFEAVPSSILGAIVGDVDLLTAVLTYHVVGGANFRTDPRRVFSRPAEVTTVQGQTLFFNRNSDGTRINQSNLVTCQPVRTTNGVVYLINSVLLPQFFPTED